MDQIVPSGPVWTVQEAAKYLKVSTATIWRWCAGGRLAAFKIGREWRIADPQLDRVAFRDPPIPAR